MEKFNLNKFLLYFAIIAIIGSLIPFSTNFLEILMGVVILLEICMLVFSLLPTFKIVPKLLPTVSIILLSTNLILTKNLFTLLYDGVNLRGYFIEQFLLKESLTTFVNCFSLMVLNIIIVAKGKTRIILLDEKADRNSFVKDVYKLFYGQIKAVVFVFLINILGSFVFLIKKQNIPILEIFNHISPVINENSLFLLISHLLLGISLWITAIKLTK